MNDLPEPHRGTGVPPKNPKLHWIETSEANTSIRFRVWSPAIWEMWTHYNGRTKPCFKDHRFCVNGHDENTLRWYGFLFGWHEPRNGTAFLQLTVGAARELLGQVAPGSALRGMIITVTRGRSKQGPQHVRVDRFCNTGHENMGQDCDPQMSSYRMWKVNHVGHAARLSLVSGPQDIPLDANELECLKTEVGALSIKEDGSALSEKIRSRKTKVKRKPA